MEFPKKGLRLAPGSYQKSRTPFRFDSLSTAKEKILKLAMGKNFFHKNSHFAN